MDYSSPIDRLASDLATSDRTASFPNSKDVWWGHHASHGWVIFDRRWTANELIFALPVPFVFVRCADWEVFSDTYENWRPPSQTYSYAPRYLENLDALSCSQEKQKWTLLLSNYQQRCEDLARHGLRLRSKLAASAFYERTGKSRQVKWTQVERHSDPCWQCPNRFNGSLHLSCLKCGWLVCWNCGGCGCGWRRRHGIAAG